MTHCPLRMLKPKANLNPKPCGHPLAQPTSPLSMTFEINPKILDTGRRLGVCTQTEAKVQDPPRLPANQLVYQH